MDRRLQISVIIVNYNAHGYILLALESIYRAIKDLVAEVLVIDNASTDGSVEEVRQSYPDTIIIQNPRNIGFAAANNIGLCRAKGDFIMLINPDTLVPEDLFSILMEFMRQTPEAGVTGCKILNADGSFSVDSRHSVPSPMTALWKQLGFNRLFPKSRIFGRYNLTYLDQDEIYPVDAVSGSFMFLRWQAIEQAGLLDELFFMYGEDIDYCYRLNHSGWKVYYYPGTSIIHFKGESTKKNAFRYSWNFSQSLYLFYKKHFRYHFNFIMHGIVLLGVVLRAILVYLKHNIKNIFKGIWHSIKRSKSREKRIIWMGSIEDLAAARKILTSFGYHIAGIIASTPPGKTILDIPILATVQDIGEFVPPSDSNELIFDADRISFKNIISTMSTLSRWGMHYKIFLAKIPLFIGK